MLRSRLRANTLAPVRAVVKALDSSSTLVTHHLLSIVMVLLQELVRGEVSQGLVWSDGIIHVFPCAQRLVQLCYVEAAVGQFVEFLGMGSLCAFDVSVQFRGSRWQDEQLDTFLLALGLERVLELRTAIHLDSFHGKGHAF